MDNKKLAQEIVKHAGTKSNLTNVWTCMTRIRFNFKDEKAIDLAALRSLDGVVEARFQGNQLQVVIGSQVAKVYQEVALLLPNASNGLSAKQSVLNTVLDTISGIFSPILPAICGAGLFKGILPLLTILKVLSAESDTYQILNIVADTTFYFLPILIALSASKKFNVNEYLGLVLGASMFYPTILNGEGKTLHLFGAIPIPATSYASSILPIILGIWAMSYVTKIAKKIVPDLLAMIFVPLIVLAIMIPLNLALFCPLGAYVGQYLATASQFLSQNAPFLYGALLGGFYPVIIMTGMQYAMFPIMLNNIQQLGYENGFLPMGIFSNMAMACVTFAVYFKLKNKKNKEVALSAGVSAFLGITEPALYGVVLKYKKPLYAAMLASGLVNAFMMTFDLKMYAFMAPSLMSLPALIAPDGSMDSLYLGIAGVVGVAILAFVVAFLLPIQEEVVQEPVLTPSETGQHFTIKAPISGDIKALEMSQDKIFGSGTIGKGCLIMPNDDVTTILAPFDGKVTSLTENKHAIGLTSDDGVDLLIHIGIDTVEMKGEGFDYLVAIDDTFKSGQALMTFDLAAIKAHDLSTEILVVVTNTPDYFEVIANHTQGKIQAGDDFLTVLA